MTVIQDWIIKETIEANFGDKRLNKRFENLLHMLSNHPNQSIPTACKSWKETIAAYRFFSNENVTSKKILAPHSHATMQRIRNEPIELIIQDTTEMNFSHRTPITGMGPLRTESNQGFLLHPSLAVTPERVCLGILDGKMWSRERLKGKDRRTQPIENKESYRWIEGLELSNKIAEYAPSTQIINIADREGDIYELNVCISAHPERRFR